MSDSQRRDPRREWILRNRLHPEHAAVLAASGAGAATEWTGPNGLTRKNPHLVGFTGPNGIKRIDRSGAQQGVAAQRSAAGQGPSRREVVIEAPDYLVAVVPEMTGGRLSSHDKDLLGLARRLADEGVGQGAVLAVVFGELKEDGLAEAGVDRVLRFSGDEYEGFAPEARLAALGSIERGQAPRHWLLPDSALGGADLGRRLAMRLGERPATGVWQIEPDAEATLGWQCTARGAAASLDITRPLPKVVLALAECAEPVDETRHAAAELVAETRLPGTLSRISDLGQVAVDPAGVALDEAEFILSAGNGIRDWEGFHAAAAILGATEGASRVAVDDGHMPRDRQVGASGTWVSARVYLALGISGAIQHLQGIQACDKVITVNTDPACDMIKRADLAVIGDAGEVLAALCEQVKAQRGETRDAA